MEKAAGFTPAETLKNFHSFREYSKLPLGHDNLKKNTRYISWLISLLTRILIYQFENGANENLRWWVNGGSEKFLHKYNLNRVVVEEYY